MTSGGVLWISLFLLLRFFFLSCQCAVTYYRAPQGTTVVVSVLDGTFHPNSDDRKETALHATTGSASQAEFKPSSSYPLPESVEGKRNADQRMQTFLALCSETRQFPQWKRANGSSLSLPTLGEISGLALRVLHQKNLQMNQFIFARLYVWTPYPEQL